MNSKVMAVCTVVVLTAAVFGGYLYGKRALLPSGTVKSGTSKIEYTCPMHPFILKEQAGFCAICGMDLVKKTAGDGIKEQELLNLRHVALSPSQQVMANLATVAAVVKPFGNDISVTGVVAYNQERQGRVTAWTGGRLDRLLVASIGAEVRRDKPIAELYSLELANAQEEYLLSYKAVKLFNGSITSTYSQNNATSLFESRQRLRQLGFREREFAQLEKTGKPTVRLLIHSHISGVVTEKFAQEGQYVNTGDPLFAVADLSRIWIELEAFENDLAMIKVGQKVDIVSPANPGEIFHGRVKLIYPFLDPKTRAARIRVELPNPALKLKPEMFVSGTIKIPLSASVVVPVGAVIDTGKHQVVWVELRPGVFVQREVRTGARSGDEVQISAGLKSGERVAATGAYLIDSEAQLSYRPDSPSQLSASPKKNERMKMDDMKME